MRILKTALMDFMEPLTVFGIVAVCIILLPVIVLICALADVNIFKK